MRQRIPVGVRSSETPHQIGQRTGDKKVFLHEAQTLPHARRVIGIKDAGEGIGRKSFRQGAHEIATAELLKVEIIRRGRSPKSQGINGFAAIPNNRPIKRDPDEARWLPGNCTQASAAQFKRAVELYLHLLAWPRNFPGIGKAKPIVWLFMLPTVYDSFAETCRIHSASHSPWPATAGWPANRENRPPAVPARRCPARHQVLVRANLASPGCAA